MRVGVVGPAFCRRVEIREGFRELTLFGQNDAETFVRVRILRVHLERVRYCAAAASKSPRLLKRGAEIDVRFRQIGPQPESLGDVWHGLVHTILGQKGLAERGERRPVISW